MANYRSNSYSSSSGQMQIEPYSWTGRAIARPNDFRSYSYSATTSQYYGMPTSPPLKIKKGKIVDGSASSRSWSAFSDPELQRKKRVASYKVYSLEGKVKGSFRKSFRWLKHRYTQVVYGW
ncbi:uncharacterized protein LOC127265410 [Andrographis paniculata]|uniref:uncharacterized protein LOC127265410 n=1 Tax=Andrographis paniculata TaxID=175694 RepID=UPI0021E84FBF|nr:uncharacterized protein LOC127265410 [Andrographis paniculata]